MKPLTPTPGPDYDHPLEMLAACHDRIEERLDVLQRLIAHLAAHGCDDEARQAAANVMRYFDTAGEFHHEDEEINLFPALAARMPNDERLRELVTRLRWEHEIMRALWKSLRAELKPIADGTAADLGSELVEKFSARYRQHIELEEAELLPIAQRAFNAEEQAALGAEMAQRRGVKG
jgi:pyridoxamine 5'-phosphate oxidase